MKISQYSEIVKIFQGIPAPLHGMYFNFHHEESYYLDVDERQLAELVEHILVNVKPESISREISEDSYLRFSGSKALENVLSLRVRQYCHGSNRDLTDLIALFNSSPGNEDVLVGQYGVSCTDKVLQEISEYLKKFFDASYFFDIKKESTALVYKKPSVIDGEMVGEYLVVSIDKVLGIDVEGKSYSPVEIFGYDKIVEIEWNDDTDKDLLEKVRGVLLSYPLFISKSSPKKEKKSVVVDRWIEGLPQNP